MAGIVLGAATRPMKIPLLKKSLAKKPAPRPLKYGWAAAVTALAFGSVLLDSGSVWLPLLNQAIDLMQQQNQPAPAPAEWLSPGK